MLYKWNITCNIHEHKWWHGDCQKWSFFIPLTGCNLSDDTWDYAAHSCIPSWEFMEICGNPKIDIPFGKVCLSTTYGNIEDGLLLVLAHWMDISKQNLVPQYPMVGHIFSHSFDGNFWDPLMILMSRERTWICNFQVECIEYGYSVHWYNPCCLSFSDIDGVFEELGGGNVRTCMDDLGYETHRTLLGMDMVKMTNKHAGRLVVLVVLHGC